MKNRLVLFSIIASLGATAYTFTDNYKDNQYDSIKSEIRKLKQELHSTKNEKPDAASSHIKHIEQELEKLVHEVAKAKTEIARKNVTYPSRSNKNNGAQKRVSAQPSSNGQKLSNKENIESDYSY
jgi:uncharacterized protein (DUF3084 family)